LFKLRGIGFDGLQNTGDKFDFDVFADDFVQEVGEAAIGGIQVDGARLKRLAASEGEQFTVKGSGLFADAGKTLREFWVSRTFLKAEFGPAKDCAGNLLKSWAIPQASWPMDSNFWTWCNCDSSRRNSVMSSTTPSMASAGPGKER
jgi:hypothetical protein